MSYFFKGNSWNRQRISVDLLNFSDAYFFIKAQVNCQILSSGKQTQFRWTFSLVIAFLKDLLGKDPLFYFQNGMSVFGRNRKKPIS